MPAAVASTDSTAVIEILFGDRVHTHYRLEPGRRVLIGRDETNHVRVNDDACSRNHCELFQTGERWILRDNNSRNGTLLDGKAVNRDCALVDGTIIEIGKTRIRFVADISSTEIPGLEEYSATLPTVEVPRFPSDSGELIREASSSMFSEVDSVEVQQNIGVQVMLADLYRIAAMIASASTVRGLCETALEAAVRHTAATFGGVLLLPSTKTADRKVEKLELRAFRADSDVPYARVSEAISRYVLAKGHGVHWSSVHSEESFENADSVNELDLQSAACVAIKFDDRIAGLMHLYSSDIEKPITAPDFEFLMALGEQVSLTLRHLIESKRLGEKLKRAEATAASLRDQQRNGSQIIGDSEAIQSLQFRIARVAPTEAAVLIRGESGVGKELVAQAMHFASRRSSGPFVCLNCAALTESLLESELFGHEKGSFTGATGKKVGKFEQADGGTLFLDEVGEMTPGIQAKFLRLLEGHPFERVGGSTPIQVDVRVVAATNRDLEDAVRAGEFRRDLYFRLQVITVDIVPLRERISDVAVLAQHFVEKFRAKTGRHIKGLSAAAIRKLVGYHWPGNVRELQNTIERAVILCQDDTLSPDDIFLSPLEADERYGTPDAPSDDGMFRELSIEELERQHILQMLEHHDWNKTRAAQVLGIERSTLDRKLKRYGVSRPDDD